MMVTEGKVRLLFMALGIDERYEFIEDIDSSAADITIENGRAKFVYTGPSDDSSFLMINQCPADVIGIKAKVTITSCDSSEDLRARICMIPGYVDDNYYWLYLDIRPNYNNIGGGLNFLRSADHHVLKEFFFCRFESQIGTIGHTYTISAFYWDNKITFEAEGQGRQVFQMPEQFAGLSEGLKGIGIRGLNIQDPTAGCTAYFDDVYIMRTGECIMND